METHYQIMYIAVTAYCFVSALIINLKSKRYFGERIEISIFKQMVVVFMIYLVMEMIWMIGTAGFVPIPTIVLSVCKILDTMLIPLMICFWFNFSVRRFGLRILDSRLAGFITLLPFFFMVACYGLSLKTGLVYKLLPDGSMEYGPMIGLTGLIDNIYGGAIIFSAIVVMIKTEDNFRRKVLLVHIFAILICTCGGVLDAILGDLQIMPLAITISLNYLLMSIQENQVHIDFVTKMNNRRRAEQYLEEMIKGIDEKKPLFLAMIEIDGLNALNEANHRIRVDEILKTASKAIKNTTDIHDAFAARWAFDRFIIVQRWEDASRMERLVLGLRRSIAWELRESSNKHRFRIHDSVTQCSWPQTRVSDLIEIASGELHAKKTREI